MPLRTPGSIIGADLLASRAQDEVKRSMRTQQVVNDEVVVLVDALRTYADAIQAVADPSDLGTTTFLAACAAFLLKARR
jgi:hypothetical protein